MKKLVAAASAVGFIATGAFAGHLKITSQIDQALAKLTKDNPYAIITYDRYTIDVLNTELTLHDLEFSYGKEKILDDLELIDDVGVRERVEFEKIAEAFSDSQINMDSLTYRNCDFENLLPRSCSLEIDNLTIHSENSVANEYLNFAKKMIGEDNFSFDVDVEMEYAPENNFELSALYNLNIGDGYGEIRLEVSGSGVDLEEIQRRTDASLVKTLNSAEMKEQMVKVQADVTKGLMTANLKKFEYSVSGSELLQMIRGMILYGVENKKMNSKPSLSSMMSSDLFDRNAGEKYLEDLTVQAMLSMIKSNDNRSLFEEFISSPSQLSFTAEPESETPFLKLLTSMQTGINPVDLFGLEIKMNNENIDLNKIF